MRNALGWKAKTAADEVTPAHVGIACIQDDELVEVTPQNIRLRKRYLDPYERKKMARKEG